MPGMPNPQGMSGPQAIAAPTADIQKAAEVLTNLADEAHGAMGKAAESLDARSLDAAKQSQGAVLERLDDIHTAMLPYPKLVFQSVDKQKGLVGAVGAELEPKKDDIAPRIAKLDKQKDGDEQKDEDKVSLVDDETTVPTSLDAGIPEVAKSSMPREPFDAEETAWNQRFVGRWATVMIGKAKQGLEQLKAMPPIESQVPQTLPAPPNKQTVPNKEEDAKDAKDADAKPTEPPMTDEQKKLEAAKKQRENLKKSMELAVKARSEDH